ncbi:unnamed protein product [Adineta ricciae]|uniref:F-box domain-containing protein n=2 Tax=Adineta ricciae TaxID=249248 RepID=A0A815PUB0_ADIRI|nr:unnamed protein product [Adineta ricciae]
MILEDLPNELFIEIFRCLSTLDLLRSVYNLNFRFNQLLFAHFLTSTIDFRSIALRDFRLVCREYLPLLANQIISLRLSNDDRTPQQMEVFLEHGLTLHQLPNLQSLSLYAINLQEAMLPTISQLRSLNRLTLADCSLSCNQNISQNFIDAIWSLPTLTYSYLNINFKENTVILPTVRSVSLKCLSIWSITYDQIQFNTICRHTPCLEQCSILFNMDSPDPVDPFQHEFPSMTRFSLHSSHIEENHLNYVLQTMLNLRQLIVDIDSLDSHSSSPIFNGYQWETILRRYLPHLQVFRLRMKFSFPDEDDLDGQVADLLRSFRGRFWLEERQWFVQCQWNEEGQACLYTLPYRFTDFQTSSSMQCLSTCPNNELFSTFHYVDDLLMEYYVTQPEIVSSIRFNNVRDLSIHPSISNQFLSRISQLEQVTSLTVCITDSTDTNTDLQTLLNRMPNLSSFGFNPWSLHPRRLSLLRLTHPKISLLDLRYAWQHLEADDCAMLSQSPLGQQCEVLLVRIRKCDAVLDLINNMSNLRTLNIQFDDDHFEETNEDEFVPWLQNQLPSTFLISRDPVYATDIHIWIG